MLRRFFIVLYVSSGSALLFSVLATTHAALKGNHSPAEYQVLMDAAKRAYNNNEPDDARALLELALKIKNSYSPIDDIIENSDDIPQFDQSLFNRPLLIAPGSTA